MFTFGGGFTIKPVKKIRSRSASVKQLKIMLYCVPIKEDGNWLAKINTKGIDGYDDITILPFSAKSFDFKDRVHLFKKQKLDGKYNVHVVRTKNQIELDYYSPEIYTTLCENSVFKGHIVKTGNKIEFDMVNYVGHIKHFDHFLTKTYTSKELSE